MNKHKRTAIIFLSFAAFFLLLAASWIPVFNEIRESLSEKHAIISKENQDRWLSLPGQDGKIVKHRFYFYNCTNSDDVIYKGVKPEFEEFGPYTYQEVSDYENVTFNDDKLEANYTMQLLWNYSLIGDDDRS